MKNRVIMALMAAGSVFATTAQAVDVDGRLTLLNDAAKYSSLSNNDETKISVGGDMQFRYTANFGDKNSEREDFTSGFSNPLTRIRLNGSNNGFDFTVVGAFDTDGGRASLEDAFAGYGFGDNRVQFGQFRLPFMREVNVDERYQLAADRSITSAIFGQGRSQGVQGSINAGDFRFTAAFSDGFSTQNTDFGSDDEADFGITGRADWFVYGNNDEFIDFTSETGDESSLLVGVAGHYEDGDLSRFFSYTGDVSFENRGFTAFAAGVGRNIDDENGDDWMDLGLVGQAGYRFAPNLEIFGRYDMVLPDDDRNINDDYSFLTAGVNYYVAGHSAKLTGDIVYSFDDTTGLDSLTSFSNTGLLGSQDQGEIALRAQFQILF